MEGRERSRDGDRRGRYGKRREVPLSQILNTPLIVQLHRTADEARLASAE
jgi:hypothetical protein